MWCSQPDSRHVHGHLDLEEVCLSMVLREDSIWHASKLILYKLTQITTETSLDPSRSVWRAMNLSDCCRRLYNCARSWTCLGLDINCNYTLYFVRECVRVCEGPRNVNFIIRWCTHRLYADVRATTFFLCMHGQIRTTEYVPLIFRCHWVRFGFGACVKCFLQKVI